MRSLLMLTLFLAFPLTTYADAPQAPKPPQAPPVQHLTPQDRARAAVALSRAKETRAKPAACPCGCGCSSACTCAFPGDCGNPGCTCGDAGKHALTLQEGTEKAIRENKPILLWIREVCLPCEAKMPGYIHVHITEYAGDQDLVARRCVIVGKPDGNGYIDRVATLEGIPTAEEVAKVLAPKPVVRYSPPPMMFQPMAMPMGGFGGGFGGGGRGGSC